MMKWVSLLGFAAMVVAVVSLWGTGLLFAPFPWFALRIAALLLLIWARVAFGVRSSLTTERLLPAVW
jgi:hypothetical protein